MYLLKECEYNNVVRTKWLFWKD